MAKFFKPRAPTVIQPGSVSPQATPQQMGAGVGAAISQLGTEITRQGVRELNEAEAARINEANSKRELEARLLWDKRSRDMASAQESSGEGPTGFAAGVASEFELFKEQQLRGVEGGEAEDLSRRLDGIRDQVVLGAQKKQAAIAGNLNRQQFQEERIAAANELRNFQGTTDERIDYVNDLNRLFEQRVDSIPGIDAASAAAIKNKTRQLFAETELNSLIDSGTEGAQEAIDQMGESDFFDVLDPSRKAAIENRAKRTVEAGQQAIRARWNDSLQTEIQNVSKNGVPTAGEKFSKDMFNTMIPDRELATRAYQDYQSAIAVGKTRSQWGWADAEQFVEHGQKLAERWTDPNLSPEQKKRAGRELAAFTQVAEDRQKAIAADPAGYAAAGYQSTKRAFEALQNALSSDQLATPVGMETARRAATNAVLASQSSQILLGVPPDLVQAIPASMMNQIAEGFKQTDTEQAYMAIQNAQEIFGDDVMAQVYGQDGMRVYNIVGAMDPQPGRQMMFAMAKQAETEADFKSREDNPMPDIRNEVNSKLTDFAETVLMQNDDVYVDIQSMSNTLAGHLLRTNQASNAEEAAELAVDLVIDNRYEYYSAGRIPVDRDVDQVVNGIKLLPRILAELPQLQRRGANDLDQQLFIEALKDGNMLALTNNDESGMMLVDPRGDAFLDDQGFPIELTWDQLEQLGRVRRRGATRNISRFEQQQEEAQALLNSFFVEGE